MEWGPKLKTSALFDSLTRKFDNYLHHEFKRMLDGMIEFYRKKYKTVLSLIFGQKDGNEYHWKGSASSFNTFFSVTMSSMWESIFFGLNDSICKLNTKIGRFFLFSFHLQIKSVHNKLPNQIEALSKQKNAQNWRKKKLVAIYFTSRRIQHLLIWVLHMSLASSTCVLFFLLWIFSVHSSLSLPLGERATRDFVSLHFLQTTKCSCAA